MAAQTATKKRKSAVEPAIATATKKVKTAKAADVAAPLKSALKKTVPKAAEKKVEKTSKVVKDERKTIVEEKKPTVVKTKGTAVEKAAAKDSKKSKLQAVAKPAAAPKKAKKSDIVPDASDTPGADLTTDQTAALLAGFSSSEDEASDDEDEDRDAIPLAKIPSAPTTGLIKKRIRMAISDQTDPETTPGVIFIGRLPHGFYEHQLRAYLSQFGDILHLRLARNNKTGRSQHYAFVEFQSGPVADIVAKTMDKYLLFDHILQVRRIPREQVKEDMFAGSDSRRKIMPRNKLERGHLHRGAVREDWEKKIKREEERRERKADKLKELGYEFSMPDIKPVSTVPVKPKEVVEAEKQALLEKRATREEERQQKRAARRKALEEDFDLPVPKKIQEAAKHAVESAAEQAEEVVVIIDKEPEAEKEVVTTTTMIAEADGVTVVEEKKTVGGKKRTAAMEEGKDGKKRVKKVKA